MKTIKRITAIVIYTMVIVTAATGRGYGYEDNEYKKNTLFLLDILCGYELYYIAADVEPYQEAHSELKIDIDQIDLAYVQINASMPLLFFKSVYKYKITQQGGNVESEKENSVKYLTDDPKLQYMLNVAAGIFGLELEFQTAHFSNGRARYYVKENEYSYDRNVLASTEYFTLDKKQVDFRWHLNWENVPRLGGVSRETSSWDVYIGYRYLDYQMPGIMYVSDFYDEPPFGESSPQMMRYRIHMGGIGINNNHKIIENGFNFLIGGELYLGMGKTRAKLNDYRFDPDELTEPYDTSRDGNRTLYVAAAGIGANFGIVWNLVNSWISASVRVEYGFVIYTRGLTTEPSLDDSTDGFYYDTGEAPLDEHHTLKCSVQCTF